MKGLANRIAERKYSHLLCVLRVNIQKKYLELGGGGGVLEEDINVCSCSGCSLTPPVALHLQNFALISRE